MVRLGALVVVLVGTMLPESMCFSFTAPAGSSAVGRVAQLEPRGTCRCPAPMCMKVPGEAQRMITRKEALASVGAALISSVAWAGAAVAKEEKDLTGTKDDPKYQQCVSECLYFCTKPKGAESRSRAECLPECRKSCATTKAQSLLGTPKAAPQP